MTESEHAENPTAPTAVPASPPPPPPPVAPPPPAHPDRARPTRLIQVAAWVGIVAGTVFVVAVIFFSGFILGKSSDGDRHHGPPRDDIEMFHRGGPPPMGPPHVLFPGGPRFQGGPDFEIGPPPGAGQGQGPMPGPTTVPR